MRTYEIKLDNFVDQDEDDVKFLKIAFFTNFTTADLFKIDLKEFYIDAGRLIFLANPRLYSPCYYPDNPDYYDPGFITDAHVIYTNDYSEEKFCDAIYKVDNYILEKTGEHLLFTF